MSMCPGTFDQSSSSSTEFCDKNQIDIDHIIDLLLQCQYSICSFIFCFSPWLQFSSLDSLFQSALHTRSTIINPRRQHRLQAALLGFQGLCSRPFNYCLLWIVINQMEMHRFCPMGHWTTSTKVVIILLFYLETLFLHYLFTLMSFEACIFLSCIKHKTRCFEECSSCTFPYNERKL